MPKLLMDTGTVAKAHHDRTGREVTSLQVSVLNVKGSDLAHGLDH